MIIGVSGLLLGPYFLFFNAYKNLIKSLLMTLKPLIRLFRVEMPLNWDGGLL